MGLLKWLAKTFDQDCTGCSVQNQPPVDDKVNPIKGIDVSHWQPKVDWDAHKKAGVVFAFTKATEGITYVDSSFKEHWRDMLSFGIIRGCYHFFRPKYDAVEQAKHFVNTVNANGYLKNDMPLVCDFEAHDGVPKDIIQKSVITFLTTVKQLTGRTPIIYTGKWFIDEFVGYLPELANYPLWVANYSKAPIIPKPWSKCEFLQYTDKPVDSNLFYGTKADLIKKFCV